VAGFHDLGGNVAEWCHDYYAIYPNAPDRLVSDPSGPSNGRHHVVRGSSWRHASISELRLSFRDYGDKARSDLGFRIARYVD
jgi:formylglycine-generating enzyme required for sulfatase activity